jgi:hypothetical protein
MSPDTLPGGHLKLASWVRFRFEDFFQRNRLQEAEGRCVMNQLPRRILLVLRDARIRGCCSLSGWGSTWPSNASAFVGRDAGMGAQAERKCEASRSKKH